LRGLLLREGREKGRGGRKREGRGGRKREGRGGLSGMWPRRLSALNHPPVHSLV